MSRTRSIAVLSFALLLAACSDTSLSDIGARSSGWIGDSGSGGTAGSEESLPQVVRAVEVDWFNDDLGSPVAVGSAEEVLAAIVERTESADRYIQASRLEIAAVLPGLEFPDIFPIEITAVTSQIVIGSGRDRLDDEVYAAFGFWTVEPYTKSRSVGQRGTLTIGGIQGESACERFAAGAVAACTTETIGPHRTVRIDSESGQTWVWADEAYEYQLFLRGALAGNEVAADFMVRNSVPFVTVADPTARVLGTQVTAGGADQ